MREGLKEISCFHRKRFHVRDVETSTTISGQKFSRESPFEVGPEIRRHGSMETVMKVVKMQLKVCEGCGALWIRSLVCGVYCKHCSVLLSEFPTPQSRKRRGRRARTLREIACPAGKSPSTASSV